MSSFQPERLRVLQVVPDFAVAGGQWMTVHLMQHLDEEQFEVAAISLFEHKGTSLEDELAKCEMQVWHLDKQVGFDPGTFLKIENIIRCFQPDVVHTHLYALSYVLPSLIMRPGIAKIHTIHSLVGQDTYPQQVFRSAFKHLVTPVADCQAVANGSEQFYDLNDVPIIPNGIPLHRYDFSSEDRQTWRSKNGFSAEDVIFVCVSGMRPVKNHSMLLEAFSEAFSEGEKVHLLLAGDGQLKATLMRKAQEGRPDRIHFLGERSDIPNILNAADVFVLASDLEGNPLSVMEAMAAKKPVVATAVGGIPELVNDGTTGILVEPGDSSALVQAMRGLVDDSKRREEMGQQARVRAEACFSARAMASSYAELYNELLRDI